MLTYCKRCVMPDTKPDLHLDDEVIGMRALRDIHAKGPKRHQLGVVIDDGVRHDGHLTWHSIEQDGAKIGDMTCGAWSQRMQAMIGFALVQTRAQPGDKVEVLRGDDRAPATLRALPFL